VTIYQGTGPPPCNIHIIRLLDTNTSVIGLGCNIAGEFSHTWVLGKSIFSAILSFHTHITWPLLHKLVLQVFDVLRRNRRFARNAGLNYSHMHPCPACDMSAGEPEKLGGESE